MDSNTDKKLDEFAEKLMKDFSRETTSLDFTTRVMAKVEALSNSKVTEYKPLISKRVWMTLGVILIGVISYLIFGDVRMDNSILSLLPATFISSFSAISLPDLEVSNVFLYAILGFTFFMGIQVLLLKNHFEKRLTMN